MSLQTHQQCVLLFDIDGTILTGPETLPSVGVEAMGLSAQKLTGIKEAHRRVQFAGRTDRQIAWDLLQLAGTREPQGDQMEALLTLYVQYLEQNVGLRPYRLLPGVREAVISCRSHGYIIGLGTGNLRRGAQAKLESAHVADLFDLALGGYADDAMERDEVLLAGKRRCDPSGQIPTIVIGDTPHDVIAARAIGAKSIAVTTGQYDTAALVACGADLVVDRLSSSLPQAIRGLVQSALS
jgi:phosphoglycolate phosphatase-like HAD superfamily hydrolase